MATIKFYDEINFQGNWKEFHGSIGDLTNVHRVPGGNWNDELQSFEVISGRWRLFEHVGFGGLGTQEFGPNTRIANCVDAGFPNKWVSSIQQVG